jgi:hypothetical protein
MALQAQGITHGKGFESFERRAAPTLLVVSYHKMAAQEGVQQAQQVARGAAFCVEEGSRRM